MTYRATKVTIDLHALRQNLQTIRSEIGGLGVCAVVKADAYGHGYIPIAHTLAAAGVEWLAVALLEEGIALREAGIQTPILILGTDIAKSMQALVDARLTPSVNATEQLEALASIASHQTISFHLNIDTGMSRLGVQEHELPDVLKILKANPQLELNGVMSHLQNADVPDRERNDTQLHKLRSALESFRNSGFEPSWVHLSNSAGTLTENAFGFNLVRPGLALYGLSPLPDGAAGENLRPLMKWTTRPLQIKTIPKGARVSYGGHFQATRATRLAVLPVGYADGYRHAFAKSAYVLIRGQRAPIVGSVCMDLCMVDITDLPASISQEDEVVLMGKQGEESISTYTLAQWAKTIPYEIVCGISDRVPRHYADDSQ